MSASRFTPALLAALGLVVAAAPVFGVSTPPAKGRASAARAARPAAAPKSNASAPAPSAAKSGDLILKGGEEGTAFRTLTVEGEDRIHIEVERPQLRLDADPASAPGLDGGTARDVLDRTTPDLEAPLRARSARETSPYLARPWLSHFGDGAVARIRPAVENVERWKLAIVDARGEAVSVVTGKGDPPREIAWDGRSTTGATVMPGRTYSYVFEAFDRAGNKRNFVGEGFRVSAFRFDAPEGPVMVFSGAELARVAPGGEAPPIVLEAATALNQSSVVSRPIRVEATARRHEEADALAQRVARWLAPLLLGEPARVQPIARVQPDAPEGGALRIAAAGK